MPLLSLQNISIQFGAGRLLDNASLNIEKGDRIALVGRNGEGKSTLLNIAAGLQAPDEGEIVRPRHVAVALLPQVVPVDLSGSVEAVVRSGCRLDWDEWHAETQCKKVVSLMGLEPHADAASLSGGMKRRVLLARAWVGEPDVLLLDEPTNHLDLDAILWLEQMLARFPGAVLFVTHDRAFLRQLATRIVELDRGTLRSWDCSYDLYLERRQAALEEEARHNDLFDKKLAQEEAWLRRGIKARRTRNEGRVRELEQLRRVRAARRTMAGDLQVTLQEADRSGYKVITVEDAGRQYGGRYLFRNMKTVICRGDKIGILGPNGCGKSTLIRTLLGVEPPDEGAVQHGTRLDIAYFDQLRETLDENKTVFENAADGNEFVIINGQRRHVIGYLEEFLFSPERIRCPVRVLSGGERSRLLLARLFARPSNVMVLDEPTNDLDVETIELLENLLVDYKGTVLLVSHDRQFLNEVVTSTLVFEGDGRLNEYAGGYDDWLLQRPPPPQEAAAAPAALPPAKARRMGNKERRELKELPARIMQLEEELEAAHARMGDPAFYKGAVEDIQAVSARAEGIPPELERLYARWQELESME